MRQRDSNSLRWFIIGALWQNHPLYPPPPPPFPPIHKKEITLGADSLLRSKKKNWVCRTSLRHDTHRTDAAAAKLHLLLHGHHTRYRGSCHPSFLLRAYERIYVYTCVCVNGLVRSLLLLNVAPFLPRRDSLSPSPSPSLPARSAVRPWLFSTTSSSRASFSLALEASVDVARSEQKDPAFRTSMLLKISTVS